MIIILNFQLLVLTKQVKYFIGNKQATYVIQYIPPSTADIK